MSSLKIEERITVEAAPARVWAFLLDPARVAACLPGAKLDGTEGDRTFLGTMKVKVGPVTMEFKGKATMSEVVESERRVTLTGTGNDKGGSGSAKMDMHSQIVALPDGGSEIVVVADVDLSGKLVRFGRGMMEGISKALFKQFAERVRAELAGGEEDHAEAEETGQPAVTAPATADAPAQAGAAPAAEPAKTEEPAQAGPEEVRAIEPRPEEASAEAPARVDEAKPEEAKVEAPAKVDEPHGAEKLEAAEAEAAKAAPVKKPVEEAPAKVEAPSPRRAPVKKAAPLAAPADNAPLDAGSLFWTVLWGSIKAFFHRLFGRGS